MTKKQLMNTCVWVDSQATRSVSVIDEVEKTLGLEKDSIKYIANNRALMHILAIRGQPIPTVSQAVSLTDAEVKLHRELMVSYLDGMIVGIYAQKYQGELPNAGN